MDDRKPYTPRDKIIIAVISAILFLLISSPYFYKGVNRFTSSCLGLSISDKSGCPNIKGLVLHAAIFGVIIWLMMRK